MKSPKQDEPETPQQVTELVVPTVPKAYIPPLGVETIRKDAE